MDTSTVSGGFEPHCLSIRQLKQMKVSEDMDDLVTRIFGERKGELFCLPPWFQYTPCLPLSYLTHSFTWKENTLIWLVSWEEGTNMLSLGISHPPLDLPAHIEDAFFPVFHQGVRVKVNSAPAGKICCFLAVLLT